MGTERTCKLQPISLATETVLYFHLTPTNDSHYIDIFKDY